MREALLEKLCCPDCRGTLRLEAERLRARDGHIEHGLLQCSNCPAVYPIRGGVPRFVETEHYAGSFGRQWTRYAVEQPGEDERTFELKTGFRLDELAGRDVLDAGCGGGRYSHVAARFGARVLAVDMSRAIDRAARMYGDLNIDFVQADLLRLPISEQAVDLAFSIGVLHHSSDARAAFDSVARTVRRGGQLAVWLYRKNTAMQEAINEIVRGITRRLEIERLESLATVGAVLGGIPFVNRSLNKLINFSNHPVWENRVCDTFDWYSPRFQSHHSVAELMDWFRREGFERLRELPPAKSSRLYRWFYEHNWIIGSGVNVAGTRP